LVSAISHHSAEATIHIATYRNETELNAS